MPSSSANLQELKDSEKNNFRVGKLGNHSFLLFLLFLITSQGVN